MNLEYHFLLGGPFRLLLFTDAGNVFGEGQPFDLADLRTTAGVELRVLLPVFGAPLRFIYATNLVRSRRTTSRSSSSESGRASS